MGGWKGRQWATYTSIRLFYSYTVYIHSLSLFPLLLFVSLLLPSFSLLSLACPLSSVGPASWPASPLGGRVPCVCLPSGHFPLACSLPSWWWCFLKVFSQLLSLGLLRWTLAVFRWLLSSLFIFIALPFSCEQFKISLLFGCVCLMRALCATSVSSVIILYQSNVKRFTSIASALSPKRQRRTVFNDNIDIYEAGGIVSV